jgi:hypothetical protein
VGLINLHKDSRALLEDLAPGEGYVYISTPEQTIASL